MSGLSDLEATKLYGPVWEYVRYGEYRYVDSTGRILGKVTKLSDEWIASCGYESFGAYTTVEYAKAALQRAKEKT